LLQQQILLWSPSLGSAAARLLTLLLLLGTLTGEMLVWLVVCLLAFRQ
jgi:hypothetical protein